jgi:N-methylhydantoinase B
VQNDIFTLSVIQAGLNAAAEEMFEVLKKTAMSPIIYEVLDVGTGVTDANGDLVSSGAGIPTFVGVLDKAVKRVVELHRDDVADGDVFITNDPEYGGVTHLNDIVIAKPVFHAGVCCAWTASIAHWADIGGKVAGSMATDVTEIFAEGLRLPAVKLVDGGQAVQAVFDIIEVNSRLPDQVHGDLRAQLAACHRAESQIVSLIDKYGIARFDEAIEAGFVQGEARARAGLQTLAAGTYDIEEEQDNGDVWRARITISSDSFTVDLSDNPSTRSGPYNTSRDGAVIAAQMIFKALCDPERYANAGSFVPLRVITSPDTVFDARPSAAQGYYFETRIRLFDLLWQCMSRAMPARLPVGHFASICGTVIAGLHPDTGRRYTLVEPQMGGWGATSERDGMDAMYSCSHGDTFNCPVEICEARYGLDVLYKRLGQRPKALGGFVGGRGVSLAYRLRANAILSVGFTRNQMPVWSSDEASTGGRNLVAVRRLDDDIEPLSLASGVQVAEGDEVLIDTAFGGSWSASPC